MLYMCVYVYICICICVCIYPRVISWINKCLGFLYTYFDFCMRHIYLYVYI